MHVNASREVAVNSKQSKKADNSCSSQDIASIYLVQPKPRMTTENFGEKEIEILKKSTCKGLTDEQLEIFLMACRKTNLDPFMRQIYAVKRADTMTIQVAIDGFRLIAERTERYAPGPEPKFVYDEKGALVSSTAFIKKMTKDGTWHEVSSCAYMDEYCQKTRDGRPIGMWATMPRTMLAKCAESQALRKAFPAEMSGIYTTEEMSQADMELDKPVKKISIAQAEYLESVLNMCSESYQEKAYSYMKKLYQAESVFDLPVEAYERIIVGAEKAKTLTSHHTD